MAKPRRVRCLDEIMEEIAYMETVDENEGIAVPSSPWTFIPPSRHHKPVIPWTERLAAQKEKKELERLAAQDEKKELQRIAAQ